jgi:N-acetylneuraminic acid mutarotase
MRRGLLVPLVALTVVACAASGQTSGSGYSWVHPKPHPALQRTEVAGAAIGNDVYVIGGFVPPNQTTATVERLHGKRWSLRASLPVALNHAAAVGHHGHVYVAGGYASRDGLSDPVRSLYRYDPVRDRWTRLPDMPTARAALALGAIDGRLYAAGGSDGTTPTDVLEIYDIAKRRWSRGPSLSVAREHLGGAVRAGRFYAVAGRNAGGNLAIVEGYDPKARRWTRLPDMPKERGGNGAAVVGGRLAAIGGEESAGTIAEVDLYDFARRRWRKADPMPTPRHGLAVVRRRAGDVYVVAGGPQPGFAFSNAVEVLRPKR